MTLLIKARYGRRTKTFTMRVGDFAPGVNDEIEEEAARVFGIPYAEREFIEILSVEEQHENKRIF